MFENNINLFYQNFNGVRSKLGDIRREQYISSYDIICGTESRIQSEVFDAEICPSDSKFLIHRRDRDLIATAMQGGGGCVVLSNKNVALKRMKHLEVLKTNEDLWMQVELGGGYKLLICVVYLKPNSSMHELCEFTDNVTTIKNQLDDRTYLLVLGDMNAPHIQWILENKCYVSSSCEGRYAESLVEFMECSGLVQLNGITNALGRTLDLCFRDLPLSNITVTNAVPFCKIDPHHPPLQIQISFQPVRYAPQHEMSYFNFRRANYEIIGDEISLVNWHQVLDHSNVNVVVDKFYDVIYDIVHRNVRMTLPRHPKNPIWFTQELTRLLRQKNKAHKKFKRTKKSLDYVTFSDLRRQAKQLLRTCERSYLEDLQRKSRSEVKPFWAYARSLRKSNLMPNEMFYDSKHYTGTNEIVLMGSLMFF